MKNKLIFYILGLIVAFCLGACTTENGGETISSTPEKVQVLLDMSVQSAAHQDVSRATTADPDDPDNAVTGEMMRSWFVVIVQNQKIVGMVRNSTFPSSEPERDQDEVAVEIPVGTTTFYTFANIQPSEVGLDDNAQENINQYLPNDFEQRTLGVSGNSATFANTMKEMVAKYGDKGIPMSNKQTVNIQDDTRSVQLEVIRMVAKVRLEVTNLTDHAITVKGITLSDVTPNEANNLFLFSNYQETDQISAPTLNTAHKEVLRLSPNNNSGYTVSAGDKQNLCFYVNESEATAENKYFVLQLQTDDGVLTGNTEVNRRFAMLSWQQINRNDYRVIPIKLEDYAIEWEVEAFSPIGVLPKVEEDVENLTVTFGYYGEFHIEPHVKRLSDAKYVDSWDIHNQVFLEQVSTPAGDAGTCIFDGKPVWCSASHRIEGEMGNRAGTSIYKLTLDVTKANGTVVTLSRQVRFVMNPVSFSN